MMLLYRVGSFNLRQKGGAGGVKSEGENWEREAVKESGDKGSEEEGDGKWD